MRELHPLIAISLAQQVEHYAAATVERGVTQGPAQHSAHVVLKLAADAAVLCIVAAVVGPGGDLVKEDAAVRKEEHLNTAGTTGRQHITR